MSYKILTSAILASAYMGIVLTCSAKTHHQSDIEGREFLEIVSPDVPRSLEFAGSKVDLDRIDMYERLDRELTAMIYTHGNTMLTIKRANRYFPIMAPILKQNGIPLDMLYLAAIESNLNIRAYSPAKAAGLWQFIPSTATRYGLEVNDYVDERYNIEKATAAACRYLKDAYAKYGNWESVAASYNGGTARITKELDAQQVTSAYDLYLVEETSRYPFRIMAAKLIMEKPSDYGFNLKAEQLYFPIECDTETVNTPIEDWPTWAKQRGITYAQLREMNPWIRAKSLPNKTGKSYTVKIPKKTSLSRSKQRNAVYNHNWIVK